MSKGDRGALFAVGLVVGVALALFFFVWAFPWFSDPHKSTSYCHSGDQECAERGQNNDDTHFWVRPFYGWLYAEDSLAQWMMACLSIVATGFSIYAVFLVRDTLDANRRAAKAAIDAAQAAIENNKMVQAEQRPWVTLEREIPCEFRASPHQGICRWKYRLFNRGRLPAQGVHVFQKLVRGDQFTIDRDYEIFVADARKKARERNGTVVFPSEKPGSPVDSLCGNQFSRDGNEYALLVCVTYQHVAGTGIDAYLLGIDAKNDAKSAPSHDLISFGMNRIVE
jgi:hypothetical protein